MMSCKGAWYSSSAIVLNVTSCISVVFLNKWIFQQYAFQHPFSLALIHFVVTSVGMLICTYCGLFAPKKIALSAMIPLAASFSIFVVLTNLSLEYNSVGFSQLCKILTTPCVVCIQRVIYKKKFSLKSVGAISVVCSGVFLATVNDVHTTKIGIFIAFASILATSLYQIVGYLWAEKIQRDFNVNSLQVLLYQAPISAMLMAIAWPWIEQVNTLLEYSTDNLISFWFVLFLSSLAAVFVNVSTFLVIGKTSVLTYNAVGHFKLCVSFLGGSILFGQSITPFGMGGLVLALVGLSWYSRIKYQESLLLPSDIIE